MIVRKLIYVLAPLFLGALSFGCNQSQSAPATSAVSKESPALQTPVLQAPVADNIFRVHWLGKKKISADTNALEAMQIWNLPESVKFEAQALDKLSSAPWRFLRGETNQPSTNLLRPLLNDLIEEESCLEIRKATNAENITTEMVLAIHLNSDRAGIWETNLAAVLQSLTGIQPTKSPSASRWSLKKHHAPNLIEFARVGEWEVLGAAENHNALLEETIARIGRDHAPMPVSATNYWLEADVDFAGAASVWPQGNLSAALPKIFLTVMGENQKVRSSGRIRYPEAVPMVLDSWNIPTNLIDGDLSSLTAVRGVSSWFGGWNQFETNPPPNQFFVWAVSGVPMETYFATPHVDASNAVSKISDYVLEKAGSWAATNELVRFQKAKDFNGLEWKGMPFVFPFFKSDETSGQHFILGGFFPLTATNQIPPQQLIGDIERQTNLVYYNWELTGPRLEQLTYIAQMFRLFTGRAQLAADSAALQWLNVLNKKLGPSTTQIVRTSDREFSFTRSSSISLTAIELQLLASWMNAREFPAGDGFTLPPARKAAAN